MKEVTAGRCILCCENSIHAAGNLLVFISRGLLTGAAFVGGCIEKCTKKIIPCIVSCSRNSGHNGGRKWRGFEFAVIGFGLIVESVSNGFVLINYFVMVLFQH